MNNGRRAMKSPTHHGLGRVLKYWREQSGMTRSDIDNALGLANASCSRWERGLKPIPDARLVEFAATVGCLSVTQMLSVDVSGAETTGRGESPYPNHNTRRVPR